MSKKKKKEEAKWVVDTKSEGNVYGIDSDGDNMGEVMEYEEIPSNILPKVLEEQDLAFEMSVVRDDNDFGKESYGWDYDDKLIIFDDYRPTSVEEIEWMQQVCQTIADALNEKGL